MVNSEYKNWLQEVKQLYQGTNFFHQLGGKIPWRHHVEIFTQSK